MPTVEAVFEWVVIGAGPAGIAAVGQLIDAGVDPRRIAWVDPCFAAGDFGTAWRLVISNTPVELFLKFFQETASFQFGARTGSFAIEKIAGQMTCPLAMAAEPLRWITARLKAQVEAIVDRAVRLTREAHTWRVALESGQRLHCRRVVLAVGAEPKRLPFCGLDEIPLAAALNPGLLRRHVLATDHLAVFGDAQSARSVLENLLTLGIGTLSHFYRTRSSVERHMTGLDLSTVRSMPFTAANSLAIIPHCNKVIYAVGFQRRLLRIDGLPADCGYDPETGIVAPGIYGLGIAYPETRPHELGRAEYRVIAIWPIMKHLQRCLPIWLAQPD